MATEYDGDPIPTVADYSRLGGTADSDDFQGERARPISDDFRHFSTQIATEYDADPIPTVAFGWGFTLCAFTALLSLVSTATHKQHCPNRFNNCKLSEMETI